MSAYIGSKEAAVMMRAALKKNFPNQKFSVRKDGSSIDVNWIGGPSRKEVEKHMKPFEGSGFDGMIDLEYSKSSFILADGSVVYGECRHYKDKDEPNEVLPEGAKEVHFLNRFVFCKREAAPDEVVVEERQWA